MTADSILQLPAHRGPIYLLRHGETLWNRARRLQGRLNSDLTPLGEAQARAMGHCLRPLLQREARTPRFLVSPLDRTRRTAALVAEAAGLDLALAEYEPRLQELSFGQWEGLAYGEIARLSPELWAARQADRWRQAPPDGESYAVAARRLAGWFADIAEEERPLVVVAHGGVGRLLRGLYSKLAPQEIPDLDVPQDALFRFFDGQLERHQTDIRQPVSRGPETLPA